MKPTIQVTGLNDTHKALKQIDAELSKDLKRRTKGIAEKVATLVRARMPKRSGKLASKTKPRATMKGAAVAETIEYAGPVEFGGWPEGRPFIARGRYIFPVVEEQKSGIEQEIAEALDDTIRKAGLHG